MLRLFRSNNVLSDVNDDNEVKMKTPGKKPGARVRVVHQGGMA